MPDGWDGRWQRSEKSPPLQCAGALPSYRILSYCLCVSGEPVPLLPEPLVPDWLEPEPVVPLFEPLDRFFLLFFAAVLVPVWSVCPDGVPEVPDWLFEVPDWLPDVPVCPCEPVERCWLRDRPVPDEPVEPS